MKKTCFLKCFLPLMLATPTLAASFSVDSAASFSDAWKALSAGDTIVLSGVVDASAAGVLQVHPFTVNITSSDDATLTWSGNANAPLPADVVYNGVKVTSSPHVAISGKDVLIGTENDFVSNSGVISADGRIEIGASNVFDGNVAADDGGVVRVLEGGTLVIKGGNQFANNMTEGRGGAICIADAASAPAPGAYTVLLDASEADIVFSNNTENAVISGGSIVDPGFANDVYVGKNAAVRMHTESGKQIVLSGGLASTDASAVIEKTGNGDLLVGDAEFYAGTLKIQAGRVILAEKCSWGNGASTASISVAASSALVLNNGSTLSQKVNLNGGSLVALQGAVLNSTLNATSPSVITLQLTPAAVQQPSISTTPWLTLAPGSHVSQAAAANLTLNLDVTSFTQPTTTTNKLFAIDFSNAGDAETAAAVQDLSITYTDSLGVHTTDLLLDGMGLLDISSVLESIGLMQEVEGCMVTGTNAMLSTMTSLSWLRDITRSAAPSAAVASNNKTRFWGAALGGSLRLSGDAADYDYAGGGYSVGVERKVTENTYVGITFGQVFGSGDAENATGADVGASVDQTSVMLGAYARYNHSLASNQNLIIDLFAGYSSADNEMNCTAGDTDWSDDAFTLSASVTWERLISEGMYLAPFIALEYTSASQDDYTVGGNTYSDGSASLLSMPIGVTFFNRITEGGQKAVTPYVSAAVVVNLSKDDPEADVTNQYGASDKSEGVDFESCSFRVNGGVQVEWNDRWTTDVGAGLQTDSSQTIFRVSASASYAF